MKIIKTVAEMQKLALEWKHSGLEVALVPTMGALHSGHLSLAKRAREQVSSRGKVVVSVYVNPLQFSPNEDFNKYPRDLDGDARKCESAEVDVVFAPSCAEMYPFEGTDNAEDQKQSTYVQEYFLSKPMEGNRRPIHFRGVTTVVSKLFHIILPDYAVFGAKDWQQAAIIRRMVRDLNFHTQILLGPIVREADGLAMSSRNRYLSPDERKQALCLSRSIKLAAEAVQKGTVSAEHLRRIVLAEISKEPSAKVDYIEFFQPDTLVPVDPVTVGTQIALAVFVGNTRLIDNATL